MEEIRLNPKDIRLIILTHGHWDHIGSLHPIQQMTGAQVAVHRFDQPWLENGRPTWPRGRTPYGKGMIWFAERLIHPNLPPVKVDHVIDENGMSLSEYGIPGKVIYTPGHTKGHLSIILDSGEAFVGDMAMNDWYLRFTPGLPIFADVADKLADSWKKIMSAGAKRIYPAHGMDFPVEIMQKEIANLAGSK